jgi:hypothetical protein
VRVDVEYPGEYYDIPYVWGLGEGPSGHGTIGWSAADPNYQVGWCQLVPKTQDIDGCVLRTYVFRPVGQLRWYPCAPEDVELHYSLWGRPNPPPPKIPANARRARIAFEAIYPNPFNTTTVLIYNLESPAVVSISIYNIMGQKVATLHNGYNSEGKHELIWDASGFPSGVYFARMKVGNYSKVARMVLLR